MRNWVDPAQGRDYWRALENAVLLQLKLEFLEIYLTVE